MSGVRVAAVAAVLPYGTLTPAAEDGRGSDVASGGSEGGGCDDLLDTDDVDVTGNPITKSGTARDAVDNVNLFPAASG